jgi:hypothetical protein
MEVVVSVLLRYLQLVGPRQGKRQEAENQTKKRPIRISLETLFRDAVIRLPGKSFKYESSRSSLPSSYQSIPSIHESEDSLHLFGIFSSPPLASSCFQLLPTSNLHLIPLPSSPFFNYHCCLFPLRNPHPPLKGGNSDHLLSCLIVK